MSLDLSPVEEKPFYVVTREIVMRRYTVPGTSAEAARENWQSGTYPVEEMGILECEVVSVAVAVREEA